MSNWPGSSLKSLFFKDFLSLLSHFQLPAAELVDIFSFLGRHQILVHDGDHFPSFQVDIIMQEIT